MEVLTSPDNQGFTVLLIYVDFPDVNIGFLSRLLFNITDFSVAKEQA